MKQMLGKVMAISGKNTLKVSVARQWQHPLYLKSVKRTKNYLCDADTSQYQVGDEVTIESCRPISKLKKFKVVKKVTK